MVSPTVRGKLGMKMCEQRIALDMIKEQPDNGGLSPSAMLLHEKQCKDFEKMEARMTNIEKKVDNIDKKVDTVAVQLQTLVDIVKSRKSELGLYEKTLNSPNAKYVIAFLIVLTLMLGAFFGVHLSDEIKYIMPGGQ